MLGACGLARRAPEKTTRFRVRMSQIWEKRTHEYHCNSNVTLHSVGQGYGVKA